MTASSIWGIIRAILGAVPKAVSDYRANKPLAKPVSTTGPALADVLEQAQILIPEVIEALRAHPGAITAVDDVLEALERAGIAWAEASRGFLEATPGALAHAEKWLAIAAEFKPAPIGVGGTSADPIWHPGARR